MMIIVAQRRFVARLLSVCGSLKAVVRPYSVIRPPYFTSRKLSVRIGSIEAE